MTPIEQYIRQAAYQRGINPDIAARVAGHEGMNVFDPSKPDHGGDGGSSFGPFQLHYGGINPAMPHAGMGDDFTKATGLDARDPSTWQKQVDFSLDHAKKRGWGNWMGAKAAGVGPWDGINMASGNVAAQPASPPQAPGTTAPAMGQPINVGLPPAQPMQQSQQAPQVAQNQPPQPSMTTAFNDFKSGDVKGGLSNVFGSLSGMAGSFDGGAAASAPAAPLQGPSQQQMQALSQVLSGLGRRRNNQAEEVNMSSIYDWSLQAANNANSDDNINWAEGQPPSSVNNSARAMMQRIKEYVTDIGGAATVEGTPNVISVFTKSPFNKYVDGIRINLRAVSTNTGPASLNVNAVGAKPIDGIRLSGVVRVGEGQIQAGGIYDFV